MTLGYDGNGNETGRSMGLTALAYNAKNQTTSMTNGSALSMTYTGDSQVERITAGSASFGYTTLGLSSSATSGTATYYTRDNAGRLMGERIGSSPYYYLFDGLGSVVALTDGTGTAVDTYSYDPYGKVTPGGTNSVANPWQYTGGYYDSQTGLVKLGQRFYDPTLGRWTQLDPLGGGYVYAGDNPVSFIDPSGLFGGFITSLDSGTTGTPVPTSSSPDTATGTTSTPVPTSVPYSTPSYVVTVGPPPQALEPYIGPFQTGTSFQNTGLGQAIAACAKGAFAGAITGSPLVVGTGGAGLPETLALGCAGGVALDNFP